MSDEEMDGILLPPTPTRHLGTLETPEKRAATEARIQELQAALAAEREKRVAAETRLNELISDVLSVRLHNTHEWMDGLARHLNAIAEATGDADQAVFDGRDVLRIKKGEKSCD